MAKTGAYELTRVWQLVTTQNGNTALLELGRVGGEVEWFVGDFDEVPEDDSDSRPCHRLNSDRPVASLYGLSDAAYNVWARSPSTLVDSTELIVTEY